MADRRSFLRGLATLPLIGGSVAILGRPTQAAVPVTHDMLCAYDQWLFYERRLLLIEQYQHLGLEMSNVMEGAVPLNTAADAFHFPRVGSWRDAPQPSTRAAVVLSAVGCPLV